jgi:hypothetical protein
LPWPSLFFILQSLLCLATAHHFPGLAIWQHPPAFRLPIYSSASQWAFFLRNFLPEFVVELCFQTPLPQPTANL